MKYSVIIFIFLGACGFVSKKSASPNANGVGPIISPKASKQNKAYKEMEDLYIQGYYSNAYQKASEFQRNYPSSKWESEILFFKGKTMLADSQLEKAEEYFKASFLLWNRSSLGRSKTLYYLSQVYERQSKDDQMIASLLQLKSEMPILDERVYLLDIPAKLASAYAREGNLQAAKEFQKEVDDYLKMNLPLNEKFNDESLDLVNRSLYSIAENSLLDNKTRDFSEQLESIRYSQIYLVKSIELGKEPWGAKSLYRFEVAYRDLLNYVVGDWGSLYQMRDQVYALRRQKRKLRQLEKINALILDLENQLLPEGVVDNPYYERFLLAKNSYKKEVEIYFLEPEVGQGITDASRKLLGLPPKMRQAKPEHTKKIYHKQIELPKKDPNL